MRTVTVAQYISLDGVVEAPERWHFPYVSPELYASMLATSATIDTLLLGRVTYDVFAASFAGAPADDPVAAELNRPAKVVVSSTLQDPIWARTTVISEDVVAGVTELKAGDGAGILVNGSLSLSRALLRAGLVDQLQLYIHPIVVGAGQRLFDSDLPRIPLTLARSEPLPNGVIDAVYRTA
jgi:dihydrofolate reductase